MDFSRCVDGGDTALLRFIIGNLLTVSPTCPSVACKR